VGRLIRDQQLVCDGCGTVITRISTTPGDDWARMHNLCSNCFLELWKRSLTPA